MMYDPTNWNWIIGSDSSRAWSSAVGGYVTGWPSDRVTRIASEAELSDVLRPHGLRLPTDTLADVKKAYVLRVEQDAERERLKYITPGDGMMLTYQEKFAQAQGVLEMGEAAANALTQAEREAQFPTLSASVGIEGETLWACAQVVLEKYVQFAQVSMLIERSRLGGKKAIFNSGDEAAVVAAYEAITWPTP